MLRAGDTVFHRPSGEKWLLAYDEMNGEISACGWPESYARASDCELIQAATDEERLDLLRRVAKGGDGYSLRASRARHQLAAEPSSSPAEVKEV